MNTFPTDLRLVLTNGDPNVQLFQTHGGEKRGCCGIVGTPGFSVFLARAGAAPAFVEVAACRRFQRWKRK